MKLIYKKIDKFGRIVIPTSIREAYEIPNDTPIVMTLTNTAIVVRKAESGETATGRVDDNGRITVPHELRHSLSIEPNDRLPIGQHDDGIYIYSPKTA